MVVAATAATAVARAGTALGDRNVTDATIAVDAHGLAVVGYVTENGVPRHVLAWGAVDGLAHQSAPTDVQAAFRLDYSGGWKSHGDARFWASVKDACAPYTGPALPFFTGGCDAPDGSFWALQTWQRNLPMRGFAPWTAAQSAGELQLSHWSGPLPVLEIYRHWTYGGSSQGFFGRLTYDGQPVYGTRSSGTGVGNPWARSLYIDTFDSDYGPGWRRDTAIATHVQSGGFCYSFVPQAPPPGYPSSQPNGNGLGTSYRVSASGPGVTPIVQWTGSPLLSHDAAADQQASQEFDSILGADAHCAAER